MSNRQISLPCPAPKHCHLQQLAANSTRTPHATTSLYINIRSFRRTRLHWCGPRTSSPSTVYHDSLDAVLQTHTKCCKLSFFMNREASIWQCLSEEHREKPHAGADFTHQQQQVDAFRILDIYTLCCCFVSTEWTSCGPWERMARKDHERQVRQLHGACFPYRTTQHRATLCNTGSKRRGNVGHHTTRGDATQNTMYALVLL